MDLASQFSNGRCGILLLSTVSKVSKHENRLLLDRDTYSTFCLRAGRLSSSSSSSEEEEEEEENCCCCWPLSSSDLLRFLLLLLLLLEADCSNDSFEY